MKAIKYFIILLVLFTGFIFACQQKVKHNHQKNTTPMEITLQKREAFDSYNATYDSSGFFSKDIKIPYKVWRQDDRNILLKPNNVTRYDISGGGTYAMLEVVYHGHTNFDSLKGEPMVDESHSGAIGSVISKFKPTERKDIRVITVHIEGFLDLPQEARAEILENLREYISKCGFSNDGDCNIEDVFEVENRNLRTRPNTIGNGTIKPA